MTVQPKELAVTGSNIAGQQKRVHPTVVFPKQVAYNDTAQTLPALTPMAFDTSNVVWVPWVNGGANGTGTIAGFLMEATAVTDDIGTPVIANIMLEGHIHIGDIPLVGGQTLANLKTALRSGPRDLGLHIQGLDSVR